MHPPELCQHMLKAVAIWIKAGMQKESPKQLGFEQAGLCDPVDHATTATTESAGSYVDDIKGPDIDPVIARKAWAAELEVFEQRQVYQVVARLSMPRGAKIIGLRWVEADTGVEGKQKIRSRLVCQELGYGTKTPEDMFAPTPP